MCREPDQVMIPSRSLHCGRLAVRPLVSNIHPDELGGLALRARADQIDAVLGCRCGWPFGTKSWAESPRSAQWAAENLDALSVLTVRLQAPPSRHPGERSGRAGRVDV
jgi:hypothetical protein